VTVGRLFLSYSGVDGVEFALRLADVLEAGPPSYKVWIDKRDLRPGRDWDEQIEEALRTCHWLLFVMTKDSVRADSVCKQEWSRALGYRKPVIPLLLDAETEIPFRLGSRQYIAFTDFTSGTAQLRQYLTWTTSPEGVLAELEVRLADANRELPRAAEYRRPAIEAEILELRQWIDQQQLLIDNRAAEPPKAQDRFLAAMPPARQSATQRDADEFVKRQLAVPHDDRPPAVSAPKPRISAPNVSEGQLEAFGLLNRIGMDAHRLGAELVAGSIVLDSAICDYAGVDLSRVVVNDVGSLEGLNSHPTFILADMRASIAPVPNRPKAHLAEWHAPVIDQGDIVTLDLARSDYWISEATKRSVPRIQREVIAGRIDLMRMPRRLDVHLVVISEDDGMLLLTRRGSHVATEPSTWMVSVGESMDWEHDKNADGVPHPTLTARRCLSERDELNLPREIAESASLRLVAIATEWSEMLVNLIVVARIPEVTFSGIRQYFRRGENSQIDAISFDPRSCATLLRSQSYAGSNGRGASMPISDISRLALLAALREGYPLSEVVFSA
jgi:hypothetical protein